MLRGTLRQSILGLQNSRRSLNEAGAQSSHHLGRKACSPPPVSCCFGGRGFGHRLQQPFGPSEFSKAWHPFLGVPI